MDLVNVRLRRSLPTSQLYYLKEKNEQSSSRKINFSLVLVCQLLFADVFYEILAFVVMDLAIFFVFFRKTFSGNF